MTWKNGRQLATLQDDENDITYNYDSNSVRISKTVNGVKYTYAYINGMLMYETRGDAKFYYSYDSNGILYSVKYTLTDDSELLTYYYTHNSRGDIIGIYNGSGDLKAHYEYDAWGNILSITDADGNAITSATHIGNLNPFRYRGYYYDSETGLYYLMSRYYDPVTHRFLNADGYFQSGGNILDANMSAYCANNPIMYIDSSGTITVREAHIDSLNNPNSKWSIKDITNALKAGLSYDDDIDKVGQTSNNHTVYISKTKDNPTVTSNTYWAYDYRTSDDPGICLIESHIVEEEEIQYEIIYMLLEYEELNPTDWNRTADSMQLEWDIHNFAYKKGISEKSTRSTDFNNNDEGKGWTDFIWERGIEPHLPW